MHIVYIAGWGRSGSTLLAALLGGLGGVLTVGEARSFWSRARDRLWRCACGQSVASCPTWSPALVAAPAWPMPPDAVTQFQHEHLRTRHYLTAWPRLRVGEASPDERRYARTYAELHHCLADTTGARVIVDSSKYPLDAFLLGTTTDLDVRVVHLVRDPRAVAHSWATPKALSSDANAPWLRAFRPASSSLIWTTWNAAIDRLVRRTVPVHRVRYEDFVARPADTLAGIAAFAGIPVEQSLEPVDLAHAVGQLGRHLVAGNPVRFDNGDAPVVEDDRWRTEMRARHRVEALLPALPSLRRYGYRLRATVQG